MRGDCRLVPVVDGQSRLFDGSKTEEDNWTWRAEDSPPGRLRGDRGVLTWARYVSWIILLTLEPLGNQHAQRRPFGHYIVVHSGC